MFKKDNAIVIEGNASLEALNDISERFGVVETVRALQTMMKEVTKSGIDPDSVNAACNCVQNLNLTIKTAIHAARFLRESDAE